jgi:hypothetical protein
VQGPGRHPRRQPNGEHGGEAPPLQHGTVPGELRPAVEERLERAAPAEPAQRERRQAAGRRAGDREEAAAEHAERQPAGGGEHGRGEQGRDERDPDRHGDHRGQRPDARQRVAQLRRGVRQEQHPGDERRDHHDKQPDQTARDDRARIVDGDWPGPGSGA